MARKSNVPDKLKPFIFHGVQLDTSSKQAGGDCPFCGKEDHFFVKAATGQFACKRCDESGNIISFLKKLHEFALKRTKASDYKALSEDRGLPVHALQEFGLAKSYLTGEWLIPVHNPSQKFSNLFKAYQDDDGQWHVISSPGLKLHPFGTLLLNKRAEVRWVCEGLWDGIAMYATLGRLRERDESLIQLKTFSQKNSLLKTEDVLCVPGSGVFNEEWCDYLNGRATRVVFDNDHPKKAPSGKTIKAGWDGVLRMQKIIEASGKPPLHFSRCRWGKAGYTKKRADGFDFRDLTHSFTPGKTISPLKAMIAILELLEPVKLKMEAPDGDDEEQPKIIPLPRSSFRSLLDDYGATLHMTEQLTDTLLATISTMVSVNLGGDQVWLRVIGPPGSGKSTIAEACSASDEHALPISMLTGFHSGFIGGKGRGKKKRQDASLIPLMDGRTVFIKDGDTLLNSPNVGRILAEMRDIWDGTSRAHYRHFHAKTYSGIRTSFVVCGTDVIRSLNRAMRGDRFIDCEILGEEDHRPYLERAQDSTLAQVFQGLAGGQGEDNEVHSEDKMQFLKRCTVGFLDHMIHGLSGMHAPDFPVGARNRVKALATFVSYARARVERDGKEMTHRPRVELGTRLTNQFTKLAVCLALCAGKKRVDGKCIRVLQKLALDTAHSFQLEIIQLLNSEKRNGLSSKQMESRLRISDNTVRRLLGDMLEFGIVERRSESNRSGQRGRNRHMWQLTRMMKELYRDALGR